MTTSHVFPIELHADPEHSGVRTVVTLSLIALMFLVFFVVSQLFNAQSGDSPFILVCGITLPVALGIAWGIEAMLKRVWHSGRSVQITDRHVIAKNRVQADVQLSLDQEIVQLQWQFKMGDYPRGGRERRIANGWFCLAVQLQQGNKTLTAFSYLSPKKVAALSDSIEFRQLQMDEVYDTSVRARMFLTPTRPDISAKVLTGGNGRYWLAEKNRWNEGYEFTPSDFEIFLQNLQQKEK